MELTSNEFKKKNRLQNKSSMVTLYLMTAVKQPARTLENKWRKENGVIYFKVTSDGTTGEKWFARLLAKGFKVGDYTKSLLLSEYFRPTSGVTTEIAILTGSLFTDHNRVTKKIRQEASKREFTKPNPEIACLTLEMFSSVELKAVGLSWITSMHEPIKDSDGGFGLLSAGRYDEGSCLSAYYGNPGCVWNRDDGFAFAVSQVGLKS